MHIRVEDRFKIFRQTNQFLSWEDLKQIEQPLRTHSWYKEGYMSLRKRSHSENQTFQCETIDQCNSLSSGSFFH